MNIPPTFTPIFSTSASATEDRATADPEGITARVQAYVLQQPGKIRNEPQNAAVPHGSFGHFGYDERLYPYRT